MSVALPVARSEEIQAPFDAEPSRPAAAMRRLPFRLADFTRIAWVSDPARETWEPRIRRIGQAWHEIEWRAVVAGVRSCSITSVPPEQLVQNAPRWAQQGLCALPLTMTGVTDCYAATSTAAQHSAYAADNGFSTVAAMDAAHEAILAAAGAVLAQQPGLAEVLEADSV